MLTLQADTPAPLHAISQGANSALESCKVLGQVLQEADGDVDQVPQR
jgi:hypothetical protein